MLEIFIEIILMAQLTYHSQLEGLMEALVSIMEVKQSPWEEI